MVPETGERKKFNSKYDQQEMNCYSEIYVSWKLTLFDVMEILCWKLAVDIKESWMWKGTVLLTEIELSETIE